MALLGGALDHSPELLRMGMDEVEMGSLVVFRRCELWGSG